jgi:hypothetical protein
VTPRLPPKAKRFYEEALTRTERSDFKVALDVEGVDQEIAVLRLRLRTALQKHPEDLQLMLRGVVMLVQALAAKYRLPKADQDAIAEQMVSEIEGPLWPGEGADERDG